ncbi:MAG: hypothetical protein M0R76_07270 [Proteobacteria bacterium]|jgi:hypothetical protein|nr:hypothetical protein [Pseudomonadota bacterium]NLN63551.1 hypothetical protein [Myxococcales bacterium]
MKKMIGAAALAFSVVLLGANLAHAQQYAETTEYSFDDDIVEGDLVRPDGELMTVRKKGKQKSLIKVRQNFIPEMLKSVEDI